MPEAFYSTLGVRPEASAPAIREAYRDRVRDVHPDVNDAPDADEQFKRLTAAKETLLDEKERARYDRLGHTSYVRHHVDCSAWDGHVRSGSASGGTEPARTTKSRSGRDGPGASHGDRSPGGTARTDSTTTDDRRTRAETDRGGPRSHSAGSTTGGRSWTGTRRRSTAGRDSRSDTSPESDHSRESDSSDQPSPSGPAGPSASDQSWSRADRDAWSVSGFEAAGSARGSSATGRSVSPLSRLFRAARALGPWLLVHLVFLATAVGTCWYVYAVVLEAVAVSVPVLVALIGIAGFALVVSTLDVAMRLSRY